MKRKHIQLCLDIILGIGILTLMNKQLFGLLYHEIAGVTMVLVMIAHIVINTKAIHGMSRNFSKIPFSARLCLIIDILLIAAFAAEGISGVMISKKLFSWFSANSFLYKTIHYFSAAMTIILLGVHVGLHLGRRRMPERAAAVIMAAAMICAVFGVTQSGIGRWLTMPFSSGGEQYAHEGMNTNGEEGMSGEAGNELTIQSVDEITFESNAQAEEETAAVADPQDINESGSNQQPENFGGEMRGGTEHTPTPFYQRVWSIIQYWGMMFTVAMATYTIMRRKRSRTVAHV